MRNKVFTNKVFDTMIVEHNKLYNFEGESVVSNLLIVELEQNCPTTRCVTYQMNPSTLLFGAMTATLVIS